MTLRLGESLNREDFKDRTCLLITKGCFVVLNNRGKIVSRLTAGEADVASVYHEYTGTATVEGTEVIII